MAYVKGEAPGQTSLFPVSLDELVPQDHLVRVIDAYVSRLDLAKLGFGKAVTKATGRPPYDPADLLKLYLYGYLHRIRSSRRLEAECQRNVEVMWLLGRLVPDHKTIANFRRENHKGFSALCKAFVQFCRKAGLIAGDLVAIDGSKFQAVASSRQLVTPAKLAKQEQALNARIAEYLRQLDEADRADTEGDIDPAALQEALRLLQSKQDDVQTTKALMETMNLSQWVQSEPDARNMRTAQGHRVSYNVQTAVDAEHALIVHHEVTQECTDSRQLLPVAQAVKEVLEQDSLTVVADAGYSSLVQFAACEDAGITAFVPPNRAVNNQSGGALLDRSHFTYDAAQDEYRCPTGKRLVLKQYQSKNHCRIYAAQTSDCAVCSLKPQCTDTSRRLISRHDQEDACERMQARLAAVPDMMKKRRSVVEHPYAGLKYWIMGHARLLMRGMEGAGTEMALAVSAYNLKRVINILGVPRLMEAMA
jgi:transposase